MSLFRTAADFARRTGKPELIVHVLMNIAAAGIGQDLDVALAASREAVELSPRASANKRRFAYINAITALYVAGRWSEMRELLVEMQSTPLTGASDAHRALSEWVSYASDEGLDQAAAGDAPAHTSWTSQPWIHQAQINAARAAGDQAALAQASADGFTSAFESMGLGDDFALLWPHLVEASLDAGALEQAAEQIALVEASPTGLVPALVTAQLHRFRGLLAVARGEDPQQALRAGVAALDAFGARPDAARTRHALAEWLIAQRRADEADDLLASARAVYEEIGADAIICRHAQPDEDVARAILTVRQQRAAAEISGGDDRGGRRAGTERRRRDDTCREDGDLQAVAAHDVGSLTVGGVGLVLGRGGCGSAAAGGPLRRERVPGSVAAR